MPQVVHLRPAFPASRREDNEALTRFFYNSELLVTFSAIAQQRSNRNRLCCLSSGVHLPRYPTTDDLKHLAGAFDLLYLVLNLLESLKREVRCGENSAICPEHFFLQS